MNYIWLVEYKNVGGINWKPFGTDFYHCKAQALLAKKICDSNQKGVKVQEKKKFRIMRYDASGV